MSSHIVRALTISDIDQVTRLIKSNPSALLGYTDQILQDSLLDSLETILTHPLYFSLGIFTDRLVGIILTKEFETQPSWAYGYWLFESQQITNIWLGSGLSVIREYTDQLFDEMETKRKLTCWYWTYREDDNQSGIKTAGGLERLMSSNIGKLIPRLKNYTYFDDCIVPAGTMPKYPYQQALVGNRIWPVDQRIRFGVLNTKKKD